MSKVSKPALAYSAMAAAAASRSRSRPSRSMSATCHRPVTTRLISSPGASRVRSRVGAIWVLQGASERAPRLAWSPPKSGRSAGRDFGLHRVPLVGAHLAQGRDLAVLNAPQAERARDVPVFVEAHGTDHALVANRLAVLDQ